LGHGEVTVRIMRKFSKKKYCRGKNVYTYERLSVPIPKKFHDKVEPSINKNLDIEVKPKNGGLGILCKPHENFSN
jgi:hypothetical protein